MKKRRKHDNCLNCGYELDKSYNYCPECGQENTDNEVSIKLLLREFTSNFFSLDSRFGRTIKPFLFKPGEITNAFISGKRVFYANPIRWYLVISIFHFFFFLKVADGGDNVRIGDSFVITDAEFDSLYHLPDSLHDDDWPISNHYYRLAKKLYKDGGMEADEIMDSLKLNNLPWFKRKAARKTIRIGNDNRNTGSYVLRQIPTIMFIILPIYAGILKLFFWRKGLYIKHLIHSIHIHSFVFFLMMIVWILGWIVGDEYQVIKNGAAFIAIGIIMIYLAMSFRKVYQTRWVGIIFRILLLGFVYFVLLLASLVVGSVVSLVFY